MSENRSKFHQEVVESLIQSKAIDLVAIGETMSKFGETAALQGHPLVTIINRNVIWNCGWPLPELDILGNKNVKEGG